MHGLSISQKLIAIICALMILVVGGLSVHSYVNQHQELAEDLLGKARIYGILMAEQASSAVAFSDRETARELLDSFVVDPEVAAVRLYDGEGRVLFSTGEVSSWADKATRATGLRVFDTGPRVASVAPIITPEGPRGTLIIELYTDELRREQGEVMIVATIAGLAAIAIGALAAWWIARRFASRIRAIARAATRVAAGDLEQELVVDPSRDEIGLLASAFNKMLAQLRQLIARIQELAQQEKAQLETLVQERTAQLELRNLEMRQIFDQVDQGLLIVDRDGALAEQRSASVERLLGPAPEPQNLLAYVRQFAPAVADWFELMWMALDDGMLPLDIALAQLPGHFEVGGRHLELSYKPFADGGGKLRVLVVITDATAAVERQRSERDERETATLMTRLLRDRRGSMAFLTEVTNLVARLHLPEASDAELRRTLHTIKGSCASEQLGSLAELAHEIETLAEDDLRAARARTGELAERWRAVTSPIRVLIEASRDRVDVRQQDLEMLEEAIDRIAPHPELAKMVAGWRDELVVLRFERFAAHATQLAAKLGKSPVEVKVEVDPELRLPEEHWAPFWAAFLHPLNNAVDHGLLPPEERASRGRPEVGRLRLGARVVADQLTIELQDDGGGISWDKVAASARRMGLPAETPADLTEAIFSDGLSTRDEVTMSSGRGVGMAALHQVVTELGGRIAIDSSPEHGTTLCFTWPYQAVAEEASEKSAPAATVEPGESADPAGSAQRTEPRDPPRAAPWAAS